MTSLLTKILITVVALFLCLISYNGALDEPFRGFDERGKVQLNSNLKKASYAFFVLRGFNAVISVAQGTRLHLQPAGVGVTVAIGEALDSINDLVEQCSWVMLLSVCSLVIQKILMEIGIACAFKYILPLGLLIVVFGLWFPKSARKSCIMPNPTKMTGKSHFK
jgi:hypothetical protein